MIRYDANLVTAGLHVVPLRAPGPETTWQFELAPGAAYDDVAVAFWCAGAG
jgi:hypothetical protein